MKHAMRILAVTLMVCLLSAAAGIVPFALGGAGTEEEPYLVTTFEDLKTAVSAENSYIRLDADISYSEQLNVNNKTQVTLDLNGHRLEFESDNTYLKAVNVSGSGTSLVILDSKGDNSGTIISNSKNSVIGIASSASVTLESGTIMTAEDVSVQYEISKSTGTTFIMNGGVVRSNDINWVNLNATVKFNGGRVFGPAGLNKNYYDAAKLLVRDQEGALTLAEKDAPPADYHINYGDIYYDCYGTIANASTGLYNAYKDENGVVTITINPDGTGTAPSVTVSKGQTLHFILNEGASLLASDSASIQLSEGAEVTVTGGSVEEGFFTPYDSTMIIQKERLENGDDIYTAVRPLCFTVGEEQFNDIDAAIESAILQKAPIVMTQNSNFDNFQIPKDADVTLDLGGNTLNLDTSLTVADEEVGKSFIGAVDNQGSLTIRNGVMEISGNRHGILSWGTLTVEKDAEITTTYGTNKNNSTLVNFGGTVTVEGTVSSSANGCITTHGGNVFVKDGSRLVVESAGTGINIFNRAYGNESAGANVEVSGGVIETYSYAMSTNFIRSGGDTPSKVTVTGGEIESYRSSFYMPTGELVIGSEETGAGPSITSTNGSCVEISSGTLAIYGGTFTANVKGGETGETTEEIVNAFRNHSGAGNAGDAVTVVAQRADTYAQNPLSVSISGGEFQSVTDYGIRVMDCNQAAGAEQCSQEVSLSVAGGRFIGGIAGIDAKYLDPAEKPFISGGTYNNEVAKDLVQAGCIVTEKGDGTYQVEPSPAEFITTASLGSATVTVSDLAEDDAVEHLPDTTYQVVMARAPQNEVDAIGEAFSEELEGKTTVSADIYVRKISSDGTETEIELKGRSVTLMLPVPAEDGSVSVYHYDGTAAEKIQNTTLSADGLYVSFVAPSFSTYQVAYAPRSNAEVTGTVKVEFAPITDQEYYLYLSSAEDGKIINGLTSAELTFQLNGSGINYKVLAYEGSAVNVRPGSQTNSYLFSYDGINQNSESGSKIAIAKIVFGGFGSAQLSIDPAGVNVANTTKTQDSIVEQYTPRGVEGILDINEVLSVTSEPERRDLVIDIEFPNQVESQPTAYQDMTVTVSGGDLADALEYKLGSGGVEMVNGKYTIRIEDQLSRYLTYTVTVKGAGYRTAVYTVNMTEDKTLHFWNNVMSAAQEIETGNANSAKTTTFLAGDIMQDGVINLYDLSAVVSYFGTDNLVSDHPAYAKYDLNRDGKIDSKDIAFVLVSWGN